MANSFPSGEGTERRVKCGNDSIDRQRSDKQSKGERSTSAAELVDQMQMCTPTAAQAPASAAAIDATCQHKRLGSAGCQRPTGPHNSQPAIGHCRHCVITADATHSKNESIWPSICEGGGAFRRRGLCVYLNCSLQ